MPKIVVYRPDVEEEFLPIAAIADRRIPADGLRVTLLNNGKPKTVALLGYMIEELGRHFLVRSVAIHTKPSAAFAIEPEAAAQIAAATDIMISGLGDCGSCSSCSLHDAVQMELLGVPATVVITDPFVDICGRVSKRLGFPGYHTIVVPHPVSSRDDAWLRKAASAAAPTLVAQFTPIGQRS